MPKKFTPSVSVSEKEGIAIQNSYVSVFSSVLLGFRGPILVMLLFLVLIIHLCIF